MSYGSKTSGSLEDGDMTIMVNPDMSEVLLVCTPSVPIVEKIPVSM